MPLQKITDQRISSVRFGRNDLKSSPRAFLAVIAANLLVACAESVPPMNENVADQTIVAGTAECVKDGFFTARLSGTIRASIQWRAESVVCEGMRRPEDEGARLRFSGPISDAADNASSPSPRMLTFIIGLPYLSAGATGRELASNVTLVEEGNGRFFGTPNAESCWTDLSQHELIDVENEDDYRIAGIVYCISPLPEINGNGSVTFTELEFSGQVNWGHPE